MKQPIISRTVIGLGTGVAAARAFAHEGHGMPGAQHWHATDLWGFVAAVAVIIVGLWLSRGGK